MHIKLFNESVKDMMTPKSSEDVKKAIENLPPYKALARANKNNVDSDIIKMCLDRVKPINDKLYQDTKKFNKKNIREFLNFVCTWIDEQGGESYDIQEKFDDIVFTLSNIIEEEDEYEDDEGNIVTQEDIIEEESIYSNNTIELFKQFVISYVIDYLSHNIYVREDEEEEEDYDEDDNHGYYNEEHNIDAYYLEIADIISYDLERGGIEISTDEIETILYNDFEDEIEEADRVSIDPEHCAATIKSSGRFIQTIEKRKKIKEEQSKKEEDKKPINKIKKFLGFNKEDDNEDK